MKKATTQKMDGRFKICCSLFGRKKIGDVYGMSIGFLLMRKTQEIMASYQMNLTNKRNMRMTARFTNHM
jgi:hypothetical protein